MPHAAVGEAHSGPQWDHSMSAAEVMKASSSTAEAPSGREHTLRLEPEHTTKKQVQLT